MEAHHIAKSFLASNAGLEERLQIVAPACMECGACQLNCPTGAIAVDSGMSCAAAMIYAALIGKK